MPDYHIPFTPNPWIFSTTIFILLYFTNISIKKYKFFAHHYIQKIF